MENELKPYTEYQPTEYDWLPEAPKHWGKRYLFQVCEEQSISNKTVHHQNLLSLSYGNIIKKDINSTKGLLPESFDTYQLVYDGNLILRLTDLQNDHKSLRVGLANQTGIITSAYTCLKPKSVSSKFMYYLLHSFDLRKVFYGMGGGLRQGMGFKDLKYLQLYIPQQTEQDQIVKFLGSKISKINKFIKDKKREIELLKELKQAEINRLVTKGLNPDAPMKDSGVDWIGEIPEHWEYRKLKNISFSIGDGLHGTPLYDPDGVIYFINGTNLGQDNLTITTNTNTVDEVEYKKHYIELGKNCILISLNGTIGKLSFYKGEKIILSKSAGYINLRNSENIGFIAYSLKTDFCRRYFYDSFKSTTINNLSLFALQNTKIVYPPMSEQHKIVESLKNIEKSLNTAIAKIEREISLMIEYKTSLISSVVTGKVDVRDIKVEEVFEPEALEEPEVGDEAGEVEE